MDERRIGAHASGRALGSRTIISVDLRHLLRRSMPTWNPTLVIDESIRMQSERRNGIRAVYVVFKHDEHTLFHRKRDLGHFETVLNLKTHDAKTDGAMTRLLQQELWEELGIRMPAEDARIAHIRDRRSPDGSCSTFIYTASAWDKTGEERSPAAEQELTWPPAQTDDVISYVRDVLNRVNQEAKTGSSMLRDNSFT